MSAPVHAQRDSGSGHGSVPPLVKIGSSSVLVIQSRAPYICTAVCIAYSIHIPGTFCEPWARVGGTLCRTKQPFIYMRNSVSCCQSRRHRCRTTFKGGASIEGSTFGIFPFLILENGRDSSPGVAFCFIKNKNTYYIIQQMRHTSPNLSQGTERWNYLFAHDTPLVCVKIDDQWRGERFPEDTMALASDEDVGYATWFALESQVTSRCGLFAAGAHRSGSRQGVIRLLSC